MMSIMRVAIVVVTSITPSIIITVIWVIPRRIIRVSTTIPAIVKVKSSVITKSIITSSVSPIPIMSAMPFRNYKSVISVDINIIIKSATKYYFII